MDRLLTLENVAETLACDIPTVKKLVLDSTLKAVLLSNDEYRVSQHALDAFINGFNTQTQPSPYLTVDEAAAYCRRKPKTILNHHCKGNVRSMPSRRPLLFRREDLDKWLMTARTSRKR